MEIRDKHTPLEELGLASLRERVIDAAAAERLAGTFKALSDPTRVRIVAALSERTLCVHDLAAILEMSHSATSHQLATLREMRVVRASKVGRHVFYALDDEHIDDLFRQARAHIQHG